MNYYNEWDKKTAAWLQELINRRLIPDGHIDTRSICDVQPGDLNGYTQHHFFCGVAGWPLALHLAGWPTDRPVWTGSCPCQPFSAAGKQKGHDDERHVWPEMFRLARVCRPDTIFGEQVEGAVRLGWLDGVFADLEGEGYACGAAVLGAHSVGAPHIRQRLYWVAQSESERRCGRESMGVRRCEELGGPSESSRLADAQRRPAERHGYKLAGAACGVQGASRQRQRLRDDAGDGCADSGLADASSTTSKRHSRSILRAQAEVGSEGEQHGHLPLRSCNGGTDSGLADATGREAQPTAARRLLAEPCGGSRLGDSDSPSKERLGLVSVPVESQQKAGRPGYATPWQGATTIPCADGKSRRVKPGIQLLAHGVPARVVRLRGYGNAIVPACAQAFIEAYLETAP